MDTRDDAAGKGTTPEKVSQDVDALGGRLEPEVDAGTATMGRVATAPTADAVAVDLEDALDYLLSAAQDPEVQTVTRTLRVNVGSSQQPRYIKWVIKNLPGPLIRKIRDDAETQARRTKGSSGAQAGFDGNLRIVVEGTVDPDIKGGARQLSVADPGAFLETALESKQGLIEQIAGGILTLSGYDEDDVNDEIEARAAGNS